MRHLQIGKEPDNMAPIAQQIADMVDMLPENDQALAFEVIKKMVLAWDPDLTKVTAKEKTEIDQAEKELEAGEFVLHSAINWD